MSEYLNGYTPEQFNGDGTESQNPLVTPIRDALIDRLTPWVDKIYVEELPSIQALEIARDLGIPSTQVVSTVAFNQVMVPFNKDYFDAFVRLPYSYSPAELAHCAGINVSPKKVIRDSRYTAYEGDYNNPTAVKKRFNSRKARSNIVQAAYDNTLIEFLKAGNGI